MRKDYKVAVTGILVTALLISIIPGCGKKDKGEITQNPEVHQEASLNQRGTQTEISSELQTETQKDSETQVETQ